MSGIDWLSGRNEFRKWRSNEDEANETVLFYCRNLEVRKTYSIVSRMDDWLLRTKQELSLLASDIDSLAADSRCDELGGEDIAIAMCYRYWDDLANRSRQLPTAWEPSLGS